MGLSLSKDFYSKFYKFICSRMSKRDTLRSAATCLNALETVDFGVACFLKWNLFDYSLWFNELKLVLFLFWQLHCGIFSLTT